MSMGMHLHTKHTFTGLITRCRSKADIKIAKRSFENVSVKIFGNDI
jgi:hypothetical protein